MSPVRSSLLAVALGATVAVAGFTSPAFAAPKSAGSPSPSPAPSASATPEPPAVAIPRLEAALKANPNDRDVAAQLAQVYLRAGKPDQTIVLTQKLIASGTKTSQIYYLEGYANEQLGRNPQALADYEQAANLDPTNPDVLSTLTSTYLRAGRASDAERIAKRAITFNANSKDAHLAYGGVLGAEKKFAEAREQFEAAAKLDPKDAHALALEAQTYVDEGAVALGQSVYDRAIAADPNSQEALIGKARLSGQQHDVKGSIALYDRLIALQTEPVDKVTLLVEEAKLYAAEKMDGDVKATLDKIVATYPAVPDGHIAYGDYWAGKKDLAAAEREWVAAAGTNRDNPAALLRLGALYDQQKKPQQALDQYKRVTEVAAGEPRGWMLLGDAYQSSNQNDKARDAYKHSYALQHSADALLGLASADFKTRNFGECATVLEGLSTAVPQLAQQNPNVLYTLGQCYQKTNQSSKARATYVKLLTYVKPGTQAANEVKGLIAQLDRSSAPAKPAAKSTPAPKK